MAKFVTDASGATWWPNLEPMQVAFFLLAEEITQVKEAIPWIRCTSGNVLGIFPKKGRNISQGEVGGFPAPTETKSL